METIRARETGIFGNRIMFPGEREHDPGPERQDYRIYRPEPKEYAAAVLAAAAVGLLMSLLFYRSPWGILPGILLSPPAVRLLRSMGARRQMGRLWDQFIVGMTGIASAMQSGYSMENALQEAIRELHAVYGDRALLLKEFQLMQREIRMGQRLENVLQDLGERSGIEEIRRLAAVITAARRCGGSVPELIAQTVRNMEQKAHTEREIRIMITEKRTEFYLMCMMPPGILAYLNLTGREFLDPLYGNLTGALIMTGILAVYLATIRLGSRMLEIRL